MKECAICSVQLADEGEHALLFIGKYGRRYEICPHCERLMDSFVASPSAEEKKEAAEALYNAMFQEGAGQKSPEMLAYFSSLFAEDSEVLTEAREAVEAEREQEAPTEANESDGSQPIEGENEPTEEEFLASAEPKKVSLATRLIFLAVFLLLGGGALALGIIRSAVFTIVIGAIVILLGIASVFTKE